MKINQVLLLLFFADTTSDCDCKWKLISAESDKMFNQCQGSVCRWSQITGLLFVSIHKEELSNSLWQNRSPNRQAVTFTGLPHGAVRSGTDRNMWADNCVRVWVTLRNSMPSSATQNKLFNLWIYVEISPDHIGIVNLKHFVTLEALLQLCKYNWRWKKAKFPMKKIHNS